MRAGLIASVVFWGIFILAVTGCMPSRGWEVRFGVVPVSRVDNKQGLDQEYSVRKTKAEDKF